MQPTDSGDNMLAFDWADIGRCVRRRTLEAVALHFATVGERDALRETGGEVVEELVPVETEGTS